MAQNLFRTVQRLLDDSGALEPGATIEAYVAGTSTPLTLYSDRALTTTAGYVVTADAAGAVPERWVPDNVLFKFIYKDEDGATKYTRDYANDAADSVSDIVNTVATQAALKLIPTTGMTTGYTVLVQGRSAAGDFGGGLHRWVSTDQSATLAPISKSVSAVNTGSDQLTVTSHGMLTSFAVVATAADAGLSLNTVYYIARVDANTVTLHTTPAAAIAGTGKVDITALSGSLSLKVLLDPSQGIYVTATGAALDGSAGCWVRDWDGESVRPEWFGAAANNSTNDHSALQDCINFASYNESACHAVRFRGRKYKVNSSLKVQRALNLHAPGGLTVSGDYEFQSPSTATLMFTDAADGTIGLDVNAVDTGGYLAGFSIFGSLDIRGPSAATKNGGSVGLRLRGVYGGEVGGCSISGWAIPFEADGNTLADGATNIATIRMHFHQMRLTDAKKQAFKICSAHDLAFTELHAGVATGADRIGSIEASALANATTPNALNFNAPKLIGISGNTPEGLRISKGFLIRLNDPVVESMTTYGVVTNYSADEDISLKNLIINEGHFNDCGAMIANIGKVCGWEIRGARGDVTSDVHAINYNTTSAVRTTFVVIQDCLIRWAGNTSAAIIINTVRGAKVLNNTLIGTGDAANQPGVAIEAGADATVLSGNHTVTTFAAADGFNDAGTNTQDDGTNYKAAA